MPGPACRKPLPHEVEFNRENKNRRIMDYMDFGSISRHLREASEVSRTGGRFATADLGGLGGTARYLAGGVDKSASLGSVSRLLTDLDKSAPIGVVGRHLADLNDLSKLHKKAYGGLLDRDWMSDPLKDAMSASDATRSATKLAGLVGGVGPSGLAGERSVSTMLKKIGGGSGYTGVAGLMAAYERPDKALGRSAADYAIGNTALNDVLKGSARSIAGYGKMGAAYGDLVKDLKDSALIKNASLLSDGLGLGRYRQASKLGGVGDIFPLLKPIAESSWGGMYQIPPHDDMSSLRSVFQAATTYGPVVVTPDGPPPPAPDYTPSLQFPTIPDTASSDDAPTLEDVWAEVMVYAQWVARHHRTKAIVRGIGEDGHIIIINIIGTVVGGYIVYLITH